MLKMCAEIAVDHTVQVKAVPFHVKQALRRRGCAALAILKKGVGAQFHAPAALPLGKTAGTHCTGGWECLGTGQNRFRKSRFHWGSSPGPSRP